MKQYKPDWPAAAERLTALWRGNLRGRPCVAVTAPGSAHVAKPGPPANAEAKYLDPAWVVPQLRAVLSNNWWGGESVPSYTLLGGWSVCYGATARYSMETIWHDPVPFDPSHLPDLTLDLDGPAVQRLARLHRAVAEEAGDDGFLVGQSLCLPPSDMLAAIIGAEHLLMAMMDCPEWVDDALQQLTTNHLRLHRYLDRTVVGEINRYWYGVAGWAPFWGPDPFLVTQSDMSCMISPAQFERFLLPELRRLGAEYGRVWYHLDGPNALRHLPQLLTRPEIKVIQWVPGAGAAPNGEAWMEVYRQIQGSGRIVDIHAEPAAVAYLAPRLDPNRIMFRCHCTSVAEAEALLATLDRTCGPQL